MTDSKTDDSLRRPMRITSLVLAASTCVVAVAAAFVIATDIFLILFLAILFGVFLTKTACLLTGRLPIGYTSGVATVTGLLLLAVFGGVVIFGVKIDRQFSRAGEHLDEAQVQLKKTVDDYPAVKSVLSSTPFIREFLPEAAGTAGTAGTADKTANPSSSADHDTELSQAPSTKKRPDSVSAPEQSAVAEPSAVSEDSSVSRGTLTSGTLSAAANKGAQALAGLFGTTFGLVVNSVLIFFVGLFVAVAPGSYRDGLVLLFPARRRARVREVLDMVGDTLWHWLIGRFGSMLVTGGGAASLLVLAGVPMGLMLGVATGVLTFIPNIGSLIALILAILFSLPQGGTTVLIVFVGYMALQLVESYVVTPLIQQKQAALPPALLVSFQAVMGVVFGFLGAAVASPLLAALKTVITEAYVKDVLNNQNSHS